MVPSSPTAGSSSGIMNIVNADGGSVTIEAIQNFFEGSSASFIAVELPDGSCHSTSSVPAGIVAGDQLVALCSGNIAVVTVYAAPEGSTASECCSAPDGSDVIVHTFNVPCKCADEASVLGTCPHMADLQAMTEIQAPMNGVSAVPGKAETMMAPGDFVQPFYSNEDTIKFKGYQYWLQKSLSWVCFVWMDKDSGKWVGKKEEGMSYQTERIFEAKCDTNGMATVYVYAHDGQIPKSSVAPYPKVCAGGSQDSTVGYRLVLPCSECGLNSDVTGETGNSAPEGPVRDWKEIAAAPALADEPSTPANEPTPATEPLPAATPEQVALTKDTTVPAPLDGIRAMGNHKEAMDAPGDFVQPYDYDETTQTVKFTGYQYWLDKSLSWVCFVWADKTSGERVGQKQEGQSPSDIRYFEAKCTCDASGECKSLVEIYAHDGQFPVDSFGNYPKVCAGGAQTRTVGYQFEINCKAYASGVSDSTTTESGSEAREDAAPAETTVDEGGYEEAFDTADGSVPDEVAQEEATPAIPESTTQTISPPKAGNWVKKPSTLIEPPLEGQEVLKGYTRTSMIAPHDAVEPYWCDGNRVKFAGHQYYKDGSLSWVCFVWYAKLTNQKPSDLKAYKMEGMTDEDTIYIEAQCDPATNKATIEMYAHDGQIPKESLGDYPTGCAGTLQAGSVGYTLEIPCGTGFGDDIGGQVVAGWPGELSITF